MIGTSLEFYGRIERGQQLPSVPTLYEICRATGASVDAMFDTQALPQPSAGERDLQFASDPPELRRIVRNLRLLDAHGLKAVDRLVGSLASAAPRPRRR
jgi:transcriptional regulator with XRE-family HTH domain